MQLLIFSIGGNNVEDLFVYKYTPHNIRNRTLIFKQLERTVATNIITSTNGEATCTGGVP